MDLEGIIKAVVFYVKKELQMKHQDKFNILNEQTKIDEIKRKEQVNSFIQMVYK